MNAGSLSSATCRKLAPGSPLRLPMTAMALLSKALDRLGWSALHIFRFDFHWRSSNCRDRISKFGVRIRSVLAKLWTAHNVRMVLQIAIRLCTAETSEKQMKSEWRVKSEWRALFIGSLQAPIMLITQSASHAESNLAGSSLQLADDQIQWPDTLGTDSEIRNDRQTMNFVFNLSNCWIITGYLLVCKRL